MNHFKNILLLYKRSAYSIYFLNPRSSVLHASNHILKNEVGRFRAAHEQHLHTITVLRQELRESGLKFTESYRGAKINYRKFDLIIAVGGDGTFLEAARHSTGQVIFGVNSAPEYSVGRYCIATAKSFKQIFAKLRKGQCREQFLSRLRLTVEGHKRHFDILNDVLVCHQNPAVLCRYLIGVRNQREEQRSSGVWISTPAGSTGAIHSAGGKILKATENKFQYLPRELFQQHRRHYRLTGGILSKTDKISITSLMRQGRIFIDGAHWSVNFPYGCSAAISISPNPIKTFKVT